MADAPFRIGPLGSLTDLPGVQWGKDVSADTTRHGGTHVSLNGGSTVDTLGRKRSLSFQWEYLLPADAIVLDQLDHGLMRGPLRCIDPYRRNRLSVPVSAGAGSGYVITGGGTSSLVSITDPPTGVGVTQVVSWARSGTVAATLQAPNATEERAPILPGETGFVSAYVRSLVTTTTIQAGFIRYDTSAGTASTLSSNISLPSGATWLRISLAWSQTGAYASLVPQIATPSGAAAATIQTTGWQAEQGALSSWQLGGGAPTVVVSRVARSYQAPSEFAYTLDLTEV